MTSRQTAAKPTTIFANASRVGVVSPTGNLSNLFRRSRALLNPPDRAERNILVSDLAAPLTAAPASLPAVPRTSPGIQSAPRIPTLSRIARMAAVTALTGLFMQGAFAASWYVDGKYGSDSNYGSSSSPVRTVHRAWSKAQPGDTVYLKPTVTYGSIWLGGKSGYAGKPITLKGAGTGSGMTKVSGGYTRPGIMVEKGRSYINIQNLNVTAPGHGSYAGHSGIHLPGNRHIQILGNYVHGSGCSGVQTTHSDYITISGNRITRNAYDTYNRIYCSGISMHNNLDSDGNTGTKMRVMNNIVYGNMNKPWSGCSSCYHSDGNGIIVDDSRRTQTDYKKYRGRTLIQNNIVVGNGGRGVHIYSSDNVDVYNNTVYMNNRDPKVSAWRPGEIMAIKSGSVNIFNNIAHTDAKYVSSRAGELVSISIEYASGGGINVNHNLMYNSRGDHGNRTFTQSNSTSVNIGSSNRFGNPKFKNEGTDMSWADMRVYSGSPAFKFYSPSYTVPKTDFLYKNRYSPVTAGAYQYPG